MPKTIYTIGHGHLNLTQFMQYVKLYNIDCIADIRCDKGTATLGAFSADKLCAHVKQAGIYYMPFFEQLGFIPSTARNIKGMPVYNKVCKLDTFIQGTQRLIKGMELGHTILILESNATLHTSYRFMILGKYLSEQGVTVKHIETDGSISSQHDIVNTLSRRRQQTHERNNKASSLGIIGEQLAALYLSRNGYYILQHDWNLHRGCELDLIARKDGTLHFIEVKTRSTADRGNPVEAINCHKMHNIKTAIQHFLTLHEFYGMKCQIDAISIVYRSEEDYDLQMFENIG